MLGLEALEPPRLIGPHQLLRSGHPEVDEPRVEPFEHRLLVARVAQLLGRVGANRLEHPIPRLHASQVGNHERAVDEASEEIECRVLSGGMLRRLSTRH